MILIEEVRLVSLFLSSFLVGFSGAIMPGPLFAVTVSESSRRGASAGPLLVLGHGLLEAGLIALLLLGLAPLFKMQAFFILVSFAGGAVLLWMSWGMFRTLPKLSLSVPASSHVSRNTPVLTGALMSLINPYWIIWWATIGLGYILNAKPFGTAGVVFFFAGHILADLVWYSAVSFTVGRGRRFFSDMIYRSLTGFCAAVLVLFAVYFIYSACKAACLVPFFRLLN